MCRMYTDPTRALRTAHVHALHGMACTNQCAYVVSSVCQSASDSVPLNVFPNVQT